MNFKLIILLGAILSVAAVNNALAADSPQPAPQCDLTSLDKSQRYDLQQFKGKVIYVDFWASWCGPCAKSFPFMNQLNKDLKDKGLQILAINLDEKLEDAQEFLTKVPANFAIAQDDNQQCAKSFDLKAMPTSFLIDRNGLIREMHMGFRSGEAEEFRGAVERLLAEPLVK